MKSINARIDPVFRKDAPRFIEILEKQGKVKPISTYGKKRSMRVITVQVHNLLEEIMFGKKR